MRSACSNRRRATLQGGLAGFLDRSTVPHGSNSAGRRAVGSLSVIQLDSTHSFISGHDDVKKFFAVLNDFIGYFRIVRVRHALSNGTMKGVDNFEKLLFELFGVRYSLRHNIPF